MSSRSLAIVLLSSLLFAAACGNSETEASSAPSADSAKGGLLDPVKVATTRAEVRDVSASVQVTGEFVAQDSSAVAPETAGIVAQTLVDVGDYVQKDQIIARLDDSDAKLRLDQALAQQQQAEASVRQAQSRIGLSGAESFNAADVPEVLSARAAYEAAQSQAKLAQADAQRYANLVETGDVSRSAYDKAKSAVETAEAQANAARQQWEAAANNARQNFGGVETQQASLQAIRAQVALARKAIEDAQIRAPFAGYVSARPVSVGEHVGVADTIATILRIQPIKLALRVPENYSPQVKNNLPVEAQVTGFPERKFEGRVIAINPAVDTNSRTFVVEAEFRNSDLALKPGTFAQARVSLPGSQRGVFVPRAAVVTDATTNSSQVFMIRDGKARLAVVQLGETQGDLIRIISGIPEDAVIVTDHLQELYDGQTVTEAQGA